MYSDKEKNNFLGYFDLLAESCLKNLLNNELDKIEDKEFYDEIEEIKGSREIGYSYIYPSDLEDLANQVKHDAPMNSKGNKPTYIYMYSKLSKHWDINELEKSVKILAKDFMQLDIDRVELLEIPTYEETKISFQQDYARFI